MMGIPLDIFSLYQLQQEAGNCEHYLLLKVEQPEFSNANQNEHDAAISAAEAKKSSLIRLYKTKILAHQCAGFHTVNLVGEMQSSPVGDIAFEEHGGFQIDLWIAETRFGHPWVVMGSAETETAFWHEVEQDEELLGLGVRPPAIKQLAFFMTEKFRDIYCQKGEY